MTSWTMQLRQRTKKKKKKKKKKKNKTTAMSKGKTSEVTRHLASKKRPSRVTNGQLVRRYRDPKESGSLGGVTRFAEAQGISLSRAKRVLAHELGYTLHKPARRRFPTLKVVVFGPDEQWAADLVDVQKLKKFNRGVNYLLTVVDVFSKTAWVIPMKQKTGPQTAKALEKLFRTSKRRPQNLQTDDGKEFYNKHVAKVLKDRNVRHFSTAGDTKASVVERFNRTFKQRLYRYMTTYNTPSYLSALPSLVKGYNASFHRSIGMAPEAVNLENTKEVWEALRFEKEEQDDEEEETTFAKSRRQGPIKRETSSLQKRLLARVDGGGVCRHQRETRR